MAGLRILSPAPIDGNARLMERLLTLEQRMAALETKRDIIITPLGAVGPGTSNMPFTWTGGKLWFIAGGSCNVTSSAGNSYGINFRIGSVLLSSIINTTSIGGSIPLSFTSINLTGWPSISTVMPTPGNYNIQCVSSFSPMDNYFIYGLMFEWPQA